MHLGPIIQILIYGVVVGAVIYIVNLLPIDATVKRIVTVVAFVIAALYALQYLLGAAR